MTFDRSAIDTLVASYADEHHCPSIAWGLVADGALVETGSSGTVGGAAPTADTVYRIASMTKAFSAALTLRLRDDGVLALDAPIGDYAPELAALRSPTTDAPAITIRDLLTMTSGLVTDDPWADRHLDLTDDEFDRIVADGLVFAEPTGTDFEYSNFGFALLGRVVHRATGRRLQDLVTDLLLRPLGMTRTTWVRPDHDDWARPMRWRDDGWVHELPTPGDGLIAPMGGIWTTVNDLAVWVGWLAVAFPARDGADDGPLRRASRREMQTAQRYVGHRTVRNVRFPTAYGYGVRILDEPALGTVVTHSGGLPGYGSNMRWTPGGSLGVITLSNVTYAPMTELGARLHDLAAGDAPAGRARATAPAVLDAAHRLVGILDRWARGDEISRSELDALFADNVEPDDSFERRAAAARTHGPLELVRVRPINDARARVDCTTSSGETATITMSLAPTTPPRVQDYEVATSR